MECKRKANTYFRFIFIGILLCVISCSLKTPQKEQNQLKITLQDVPTSMPELISTQALFLLSSPQTITDFQCFGVNITGSGIPKNSSNLPNICSSSNNYEGVGLGAVSEPSTRNQNIEFDIPSGKNRRIDVYGLYPASTPCQSSGAITDGVLGYLVGQKIVDIEKSTTINMNISFSTNISSSFTCNGGSSSSSTASNIPEFGDGADGSITTSATVANALTDTTMLGRTLAAAREVSQISTSDAKTITVSTSFTTSDFNVGDEVAWIVIGTDGTNPCTTVSSELYTGKWGIAEITSVNTGSNTITIDEAIATTPSAIQNSNISNPATAGTFCKMQVVRVPNFESLAISASDSISVPAYNYSTGVGGVFMFRVKNTLTLSGSGTKIRVRGFAGGAGGPPGYSGDGVQGPGDNTSNGTPNASGGGAKNAAGGGGGANGGAGGDGGSNAGSGAPATTCNSGGATDCLFLGGGGGGDDGAAGDGGGVLVVFARNVTAASGGNLSVEGSSFVGADGGGGAGGSMHVVTREYNSLPGLIAYGGSGANTTYASGGGGGGRVSGDYCTGSAPTPSVSFGTKGGVSAQDGNAGTSNITAAPSSSFCN